MKLELEQLLSSYEINNNNPENLHKDLIDYYEFSNHPTFSLETERKLLNVKEMKICRDYSITYLALIRNLELLKGYNVKYVEGGLDE